MSNLLKLPITACLLIIFVEGHSQEPGLPFIRNFPAAEYRASQQNWAILQDLRGIIYTGTNDGLLEYDGVTWRLIKLTGVRSMALDHNGRVYVGLENDFGYMEPDQKGRNVFQSLKDKLPESERDLATVYKVFSIGEMLIFQTVDRLFLYRNGIIKIITPTFKIHLSFFVNDKFYVRETGSGLYTLEGDSLQFIKGSELFANERIYSMLPYEDNKILIATRTKGILEWTPGSKMGFVKSGNFKEVDKFLDDNPVYCGTKFSNGEFVLGALTGGIIVFDRSGRIKSCYNKNNGMLDNTILWIYPDRNGQLWASLDNGISLIQNNLPFRYYTEANGLNGSPMVTYSFNGHLYVGTGQSLHVQDDKGDFRQIQGTNGQNFCVYNAEGTLLLAHYGGVFKVTGNRAIPLRNSPEKSFLSFSQISGNQNKLLVGSGEGLYLLSKVNRDWEVTGKISGFDKSVYNIVQDNSGDFWLSNIVELYKLRLNKTLDSVLIVRRYGRESGLPSDYSLPFGLRSGEVVYGTEKGIYRYIPGKGRFEPHPDFTMLTGNVMLFEQDKNGDIWFDQKMENGDHVKGVLRYSNSKYTAYKTPFYKFVDTGSGESAFNICLAPDGNVYYGTSVGLLQYNPHKAFNTGHSFLTLIRTVSSTDSVLFEGSHLKLSDTAEIKGPSLAYRQHNMSFTYAAAFYEDSEKTLFSCRMVGLDTAWSAWTAYHKKEYTNLREGSYAFQVRSMNQYLKRGSVASYLFSVLPPWYRTWLAYAMYVLLSAVAIWLIVRLNIRRLVEQKKHLESIVSQRTTEVVRQKEEIEAKKRLIENAHMEITASINYAKYIQSSVLPREEEMTLLLGDHFILNKPAEIVSGDFYWISSISDKVVLAAADCTGHGVPGAFMSMLGIALLTEIVNRETITDPGVILDRLRNEVTSSLRQKGKRHEQKDGMDIAICTFDNKAGKLKFAGAINSLFIIREANQPDVGIIHPESSGGLKLIEIKGNPVPVGFTDEMQSFTTHEIDILDGDRYFLLTDGFPDQFGGSNHKKLSYRRFRELMVNTSTQNIIDQKTLLEKALEDWMGTENQTDDILVIGFQIKWQ